jgi:hypothetical protein
MVVGAVALRLAPEFKHQQEMAVQGEVQQAIRALLRLEEMEIHQLLHQAKEIMVVKVQVELPHIMVGAEVVALLLGAKTE